MLRRKTTVQLRKGLNKITTVQLRKGLNKITTVQLRKGLNKITTVQLRKGLNKITTVQLRKGLNKIVADLHKQITQDLLVEIRPVEKRYAIELGVISEELVNEGRCAVDDFNSISKPYQARRLLSIIEKRGFIFVKRLPHNKYEYRSYRKTFQKLRNYAAALNAYRFKQEQLMMGNYLISTVEPQEKFVLTFGHPEYLKCYDAFAAMTPKDKISFGENIYKGRKLKEWVRGDELPTFWEAVDLYQSPYSCKKCIEGFELVLLVKRSSEYVCPRCGIVTPIIEESTVEYVRCHR